METITIFTPTYNRAYILPKLYGSLCRQTCKDFLWLIVDDGSTDNTESIVKQWQQDSPFVIVYVKQKNGGKMRAHNRGVELCKTPLFACVDSDDYLTDTAIERVIDFWQHNYNGEREISGIIAYRGIIDSKNTEPKVVSRFPSIKRSTLRDLYKKHSFSGETFIVFRKDVITRFPFPEIEGEKFITEAIAYERIDKEHEYLLCDEYFVICEFQEDGYTKNSVSLLLDNPKGWATYYNTLAELWYDEYTLKEKLRVLGYYIAYSQLGGIKAIFTKLKCKSCLYPIAMVLAPRFKKKLLRLRNK